MKRIFLIFSLLTLTSFAYSQRNLSFTDVMVFKCDGGIGSNDDWEIEEADKLCIYKKTENRPYVSFGRKNDCYINFWTWKNEGEKFGTNDFEDSNEGLSISIDFETTNCTLTYKNNSENYILLKAESLACFYCENRDEGVTAESLPSVVNSLRNKKFRDQDYILLPPLKSGHAKFYSLQGMEILSNSLPKGAIIQMSIYGAASETDPWDQISELVQSPVLSDNEVKYFNLDSFDYSKIITDYFNPLIGFESRYHFKVY